MRRFRVELVTEISPDENIVLLGCHGGFLISPGVEEEFLVVCQGYRDLELVYLFGAGKNVFSEADGRVQYQTRRIDGGIAVRMRCEDGHGGQFVELRLVK